MKSSIKFLVIVAMFLSFNFAANAQKGRKAQDPKKMAEKQTTRMVERLQLSEAQAAKVKIINLDYANKMKESQEENKANREAMKEIRAAINSEKSAEMKTVLTEAQFKSYEEMQAKQGKRRGRKGDRRGKK